MASTPRRSGGPRRSPRRRPDRRWRRPAGVGRSAAAWCSGPRWARGSSSRCACAPEMRSRLSPLVVSRNCTTPSSMRSDSVDRAISSRRRVPRAITPRTGLVSSCWPATRMRCWPWGPIRWGGSIGSDSPACSCRRQIAAARSTSTARERSSPRAPARCCSNGSTMRSDAGLRRWPSWRVAACPAMPVARSRAAARSSTLCSLQLTLPSMTQA